MTALVVGLYRIKNICIPQQERVFISYCTANRNDMEAGLMSMTMEYNFH